MMYGSFGRPSFGMMQSPPRAAERHALLPRRVNQQQLKEQQYQQQLKEQQFHQQPNQMPYGALSPTSSVTSRRSGKIRFDDQLPRVTVYDHERDPDIPYDVQWVLGE